MGDLNIGLHQANLLWFGKSGMKWPAFLNALQYQVLFRRTPFMIIIHLGGNSVAELSQKDLCDKIKTDIKYVRDTLKNTHIVWCDMLPRNSWRNNLYPTPKVLNKKLRRINRTIKQYIQQIESAHCITFKIHESMN